ncbi:MAG: hypothetical protein QOI13_3447 [Paraburkholderia sp.]|jgi:hypothetical protein|nr:hypothetical protein [Paraburkholderia sp.]
MNTRHIQTFLMASAAFFAMSLQVQVPSGPTVQSLAAAVSHTARIASAGVGDEAATK